MKEHTFTVNINNDVFGSYNFEDTGSHIHVSAYSGSGEHLGSFMINKQQISDELLTWLGECRKWKRKQTVEWEKNV